MKALRKDFLIEIKKTLPRFLSIFFIVTLGVAFFSGLRGTAKDMRLSLDQYFDEKKLYDIQVVSTMGLTTDDVAALQDMEQVQTAEGGYDTDVLCELDEIQYVLKVRSIYDDMNTCHLEKGEWAKTEKECVVDDYFASQRGLQIGDQLTFQSGSDEQELGDVLKNDTYTITGFVAAPMYISYERETSTIGQGVVNGFVLLEKDQFVTDYFTQIDLILKGTTEEISYTDGYDQIVSDAEDRIKETLEQVRCDARYEEIQSDANTKLADAKTELADAKTEWEDGKQELADNESTLQSEKVKAYKKLADSRVLLEEKEAEISANESLLAQKQTELQQGQTTITETKTQLDQKQKELDSSQKKLTAAQKKLDTSQTELDTQSAALDTQLAGLVAQGIPESIAKEQLSTYYTKIEQAQKKIDASQKKITKNQGTIDAGQLQINAGYEQIKASQAEIDSGNAALQSAYAQIADGKQQIADGWEQYTAGKQEADDKFADAEAQIAEAKVELADGEEKIKDADQKIKDAEEEIADIEYPEWYVLDRSDLPQYDQGGENANRIAAISKVFPAIFFLVAALISLTTMTRMVEEERTIIGTYKALGYSKNAIAMKYLLYAFLATIGGSIAGILFGQKFLPWIIVYCYQIMYMYIPNIVIPYQIAHGATAMIIALACTVGAAWFACNSELLASPAKLMRPVAPKAGQRVWAERIPFLWKRLSFSQKAALRNMFRYKKRLFMTIFGIGGCMGLMLVGFGIKDSISVLGDRQYSEIFSYDGIVVYEEEYEAELNEMLATEDAVSHICNLSLNTVDVKSTEKTASVYLNVVNAQDMDEFNSVVELRDRKSGEHENLTEQGVIISEKLAKLMNVKNGDSINIEIDHQMYQAEVTDITEQYLHHYVYMTSTYFRQLTSTDNVENAIYYSTKSHNLTSARQIGGRLLKNDHVLQVTYADDLRDTLDNMFGSLNLVIVVLITAAGLLAFVVLYNLNNININERKRELASIRVLGFYNLELAAYVYRENIWITIIGIVFGWGFGALLHRFIIITVEVDNCMFGRTIFLGSYVYSAIWTAIFAITVNFVMYFKLKKIDMIESLKSVE